MRDHSGKAVDSFRSPGRGCRRWRRPVVVALGILLGPLLLASAACGSANLGESAARQLAFGVSMAERGLWSEALFRFERAHQLDPTSFRVLNNLAVAYEANGHFDQALATYRRALEIDPANRDLRSNYARFVEFYQAFRPEEAAEAETGAEGDAAEPAAAPSEEPVPPPPAVAPDIETAVPDGGSGMESDRGQGKEVEP